MDTDGDFQKVRQAGGTITFNIREEGGQRSISIGFQGRAAYPLGISGLYALLPQGIPIAPLMLRGIGEPMTPPPIADSLMVFLPSDRDGMFGRRCPSCNGYFRTKGTAMEIHCPYCDVTGAAHQFLSEAQSRYVRVYVKRFLEGLERNETVSIDLDRLGEETHANEAPSWFAEERQQTNFQCAACNVLTDIVGRYGSCSGCGRRNALAILSKDLDVLEDRVKNPRYTDRQLRDAEWRNVVRDCVSAFESFSRDLLAQLSRIPSSPRRKRALGELTFHNPIKAAQAIRTFFDVDLLTGLNEVEQEFIRLRFLRRHIYEHRGGVADQEYIDDSGDISCKVGQLVRERSSNVLTLISLVRTLAKNFDEAVHSIE